MFEGSHPALSPSITTIRYSYKYPKAGQDNSKVSLWSYDKKNGKTVALDVPVDSDGYYPRIKTSPDANSLIVYTMNRHQDDMRLMQSILSPARAGCSSRRVCLSL